MKQDVVQMNFVIDADAQKIARAEIVFKQKYKKKDCIIIVQSFWILMYSLFFFFILVHTFISQTHQFFDIHFREIKSVDPAKRIRKFE